MKLKHLFRWSNEEELEHVKQRYGYDLDYEMDDPYKQIVRYGFCHLYSSEYTVEEERKKFFRSRPRIF